MIDALDGLNGDSAFEIARRYGFRGAESEWLKSLHGRDGRDGIDGKDGRDGVDGRDGLDGARGERGIEGARGQQGLRGEQGPAGRDAACNTAATAHFQRDSRGLTSEILVVSESGVIKITTQRGVDGKLVSALIEPV